MCMNRLQTHVFDLLGDFGAAVNKSAASAASREGLQAKKLDFQAVIKSAASAASRNPRGAQPPPSSACRAVVRGLPWDSWRLR